MWDQRDKYAHKFSEMHSDSSSITSSSSSSSSDEASSSSSEESSDSHHRVKIEEPKKNFPPAADRKRSRSR